MIDIENALYTVIATALRGEFSSINVAGEYIPVPTQLPFVSITESDNRVMERFRTVSSVENVVTVMYEVNVYSNKAVGKKQEAKTIANFVDDIMTGYGFTRTFMQRVPNEKDATIYRILCRYEAQVTDDGDGDYTIYHS